MICNSSLVGNGSKYGGDSIGPCSSSTSSSTIAAGCSTTGIATAFSNDISLGLVYCPMLAECEMREGSSAHWQ